MSQLCNFHTLKRDSTSSLPRPCRCFLFHAFYTSPALSTTTFASSLPRVLLDLHPTSACSARKGISFNSGDFNPLLPGLQPLRFQLHFKATVMLQDERRGSLVFLSRKVVREIPTTLVCAYRSQVRQVIFLFTGWLLSPPQFYHRYNVVSPCSRFCRVNSLLLARPSFHKVTMVLEFTSSSVRSSFCQPRSEAHYRHNRLVIATTFSPLPSIQICLSYSKSSLRRPVGRQVLLLRLRRGIFSFISSVHLWLPPLQILEVLVLMSSCIICSVRFPLSDLQKFQAVLTSPPLAFVIELSLPLFHYLLSPAPLSKFCLQESPLARLWIKSLSELQLQRTGRYQSI